MHDALILNPSGNRLADITVSPFLKHLFGMRVFILSAVRFKIDINNNETTDMIVPNHLSSIECQREWAVKK